MLHPQQGSPRRGPCCISIAYVDKYASKSNPGDYRIEFLDYDWTVNDQWS